MIIKVLLAVMMSLFIDSCTISSVKSVKAQTQGALEEAPPPPNPDPLEGFNQPVFQFNLKLDEYVLRPVATGYAKIVPIPGRRRVDNFFKNLFVVQRFANNLFQGKFPRAGQAVGRFVINTTIGGVGLFDVADDWLGWKDSGEDFGQTLAFYGLSSGPYLVLPFWGPSTIRDTVGLAADAAMNPMNYLLSTTEALAVNGGLAISNAINARSLNLELFEDADRYSVDLYGAVQDAYLQTRARQIEE